MTSKYHWKFPYVLRFSVACPLALVNDEYYVFIKIANLLLKFVINKDDVIFLIVTERKKTNTQVLI